MAQRALSNCTWACRSCLAVPMKWAPSAILALLTLHQVSGWAWSCAVLRGRMTVQLALGATSAVGLSMASWCARAGSLTVVLTEPSWWRKAAETKTIIFFSTLTCLSALSCSYSSLVNKRLDGWRDNMLPEDEMKHFESTKDRVISHQFSLCNEIYCVLFGVWMMLTRKLSSVICFLIRECSPWK